MAFQLENAVNPLQPEPGANNFDPNNGFGPIELNILERIEVGLNVREDEQSQAQLNHSDSEKYTGPKEVIFVSGWVDIDSIYQRFAWGFFCKILIGFAILFSLKYNNQNFWPVAALFVLINAGHILKNVYFLVLHRNSHYLVKNVFLLELHFACCYLVYFLGFALLYLHMVNPHYFLFYSLPFLFLTIFVFFHQSVENSFYNYKKFAIFEGLQLTLIAIKFTPFGLINWNYTLLIFMAGAIFFTVLGLLMSIILSCSLFGFLYRNLEAWKVQSLIWMTWYYLWSGMIYIYLIKGVIQYFNEDDFYEQPFIENFVTYRSKNFDILYVSAILLIFFSMMNLMFHLIWKEQIKKFLAKVIYKNEQKREISMRFLADSYIFRLIQVSSTYFVTRDKDESAKPRDKSNEIASNPSTLPSKEDETDLCVLCYDQQPNIMMDPCGHGGVCKRCLISYLKETDSKCLFCKKPFKRLFLIGRDPKDKQFYAKGEIKFK